MKKPPGMTAASGPTIAPDAAIIAAYRASGSGHKVDGVASWTVYRVLERAGEKRRDRSEEKAARLEALAALEAEGVPRGQLAEKLGVSKTQLYRYLREGNYPHRRRRPDLTRALTEAHAETQAVVRARMDEKGLVDTDGVAAILKLSEVGARGWLRTRGVRPVETVPAAEHVLGAAAGRVRLLYDPREITDEIKAWLQEFVDEVWRGDPWRAARWYDHRFDSTVMHGRLAKPLAETRGDRVGRRLHVKDVEAVQRKAAEMRRLQPSIGDEDLVDWLIVYFKGRDAIKQPDGRRRLRRDPKYQAAERWVKRRLNAPSVDINPPAT